MADRRKVKTAEGRRFLVRSGVAVHQLWDIDDLIDVIDLATGGGGGVPVLDPHTGEQIALAHPDADGILTYTDPNPVVVHESSTGSPMGGLPAGRLVPVRVVPPVPNDTADSSIGGISPAPIPTGPVPVQQPNCNATECSMHVPCFPSGVNLRIPAQGTMFDVNTTGPASIYFVAAAHGDFQATMIKQVNIEPGTPVNISQPAGTDSVFLGCRGEGSVTIRWNRNVG